MIATLKEGKSFDGFTPGKEYKYYDEYNIEHGSLTFHIKSDDTGTHRTLTHREFTQNFWGSYNDKLKIK